LRAVLVADVEGVGVSVAVTVTVIMLGVELAVAEAGTALVDELSPSPPPQSPSSFESVVSFPVMPP